MNKYLKYGDKLLFVVNPGEGEECYKNIVTLNRIPNHYSDLLLGYFSQESEYCVIIHLDNNSGRLISSNLKKNSELIKSINCIEIELKNTSYESINDTINEIQSNYSKVSIYTIINDNIIDFLDLMNENNMNRENYKIIILDIIENIIDSNKEENRFNDIYFISSYSNLIDSGSNFAWLEFIDSNSGKPNEMCNEISYAMFNSLSILNLVIPLANNEKSESILKELYRNKYDLPIGSTTIESNNLIGIEILLNHYINNEYKLILIPRNGFRLQNQYSLVFSEDENEYKHDFTISDELIKSSNKRVGIWLNEDDKDDRIYYILKQYEIYINSNGGFKGNPIQLSVRYCLDNNEELSEMINNTDYEIILSNCNREVIESHKSEIEENNVTVFSIRQEDSNICDDKIIHSSTSPSRRILPLIEYLLSESILKIILIYPIGFEETSDYELLTSSINALGAIISKEYKVNETDIDNIKSTVSAAIVSVRKYLNDGGIIFNLLESELSNLMYEKLFNIMSYLNHKEYENSLEISSKYRIVSRKIENFKKIDKKYREGHYCESLCYPPDDSLISNLRMSTFGNDSVLSESESIGIATIEYIINGLKSDINSINLLEYLQSSSISTSFGEISIGYDNYINFPMSLLTSIDGKIKEKVTLYKRWDSDTYRSNFNEMLSNRKECDIKNDNLNKNKIIISLVLLFPSTGSFAYRGVDLVASYLSTIEYLNKEENESGLYYNPIIYDSGGNVEDIRRFIHEIKSKYKTLFLFGLYADDLKNKVMNDLEEEELILFYPTDYDGDNCNKNIFYTGIPFPTKYPVISWIDSHLGKTIYIVHSEGISYKEIANQINMWYKERGINVLRLFQIPMINYKIEDIVSTITSELSSGVIISLLDGKAATDFLIEMDMKDHKYPTYKIVNFFMRSVDAITISNRLNGHYMCFSHTDIITELHKPEDKITEIFQNTFAHYTSNSELLPSAIISILLVHDTLKSLNLKIDENNPNNIPYSFDDVLDKLHEGNSLSYFPKIHTGVNHHVSYSFSLYEITSDSSNTYNTKLVLSITSESTANEYNSHYLSEEIYQCDWVRNNESGKISEEYVLIGLLISISGSTSELEYSAIDPIIGGIKSINENGGLNGYYIDYKIFDTGSESKSDLDVIEEAIKNPKIVTFIGCYLNKCRKTISKFLLDYNKLLWYPTVFQGQECSSNVFYTGAIPNQFIDPIVTYLSSTSEDYSKSLYFLGYTGEFSDDIFSVLSFKLSSAYQIETYYVNDLSQQNDVSKTITLKYIGGTIITTLADAELVSFLEYFNQYVIDESVFRFLCLNADRSIMKLISHTSAYEILLVGSYFDEMNPNSEFHTTIYEYTGRTSHTMYGDSVYMALQFWSKAVNESNSFHESDYIPYLYLSKIESGSGKVVMNNNHYTSLFLDIARWKMNSEELEIVFSQSVTQTPMAWNWDIESTHGYICNYNDSSIGEKKQIKALDILLVISNSGTSRSLYIGLQTLINLAMNEVSQKYKGGLLNREFYLTVVDDESNNDICLNKTKEILKDLNPDVIFTTSTSDCVKSFLPLIAHLDVPLFRINYAGGELCEENVFISSKEPSVIDRIIDIYYDINDESKCNYHIIGTTDAYSKKAVEYLTKYLEFKSATLLLSLTVSPGLNDFHEIMTNIVDSSPNGGTIIFFGSKENHLGLSKAFSDNNVDLLKFHLISYTTGENMIGTNVNEFYSSQSFFSALETSKSKEFVSKIKAYTSDPISELMESTYVIFNIWADSVEEAGSTNLSIVKKYIYNREFDSPEGKVSLKPSNYLSHFLSFALFKDNKFTIEYTSSSEIVPVVYKKFVNDGTYICDFSDETIGSHQKDLTVTIGVINSLTGTFSVTERALSDGIILAANEINTNGGVLGRKILLEVRDPESNLDKYVSQSKDLCRLDEVVAIFGNGRYKNLMNMYKIFEQYKKPYFYPGVTATEVCSGYTFVTQSTTSQIVRSFEKYVYPYYNSFILVMDISNSFSVVLCKAVIPSIERISGKIYGPYNYTDLDPLYNLGTEIISKSAIIHVSGADAENPIYTYYCSHGITGKTAHIFSATLDSRIVSTLDISCMTGVSVVTTFIQEMGDPSSDSLTYLSSAETFVTAVKNSYGNNVIISAAMEAAYTAVKLWADVVTNTYSFDTESLRSTIYGYTYDSPTGSLEMNTNGIVNRILFLAEVTEEGKFRITESASKPVQSEAYDQLIEGNEGYTCDWTDKGDYYLLKNMKIIFIHEEKNRERELILQNYESYMIQDINYNKLNGYFIIPVFIYGSNVEEFHEKLSPYLNDSSVRTIFGCQSIDCRNMIENEIKSYDKFFYYLGIGEGNDCLDSTITVGNTPYQLLSLVVDYLYDQGIKKYIFIGDDTDINKNYNSILLNYVKKNSKGDVKSFILTNSKFTDDDGKEIIRRVKNFEDEDDNRIGLLNCLEYSNSLLLLNYLHNSNSLTSSMKLVILKYSSYEYSEELLSKFERSLLVSSFTSTLSSSSAESFISDTKSNIGINIEISEELENTDIAITIWKNAMIQAAADSGKDIPPLDYLEVCTVGTKIETASGSIKVENSGYVTKNVYIFEINQKGQLNQIYPYRGSEAITIEANPFTDSNMKCNFGKREVAFEYSNGILAIFYVLMGLSSLFSLISFIFTVIHRNQKIIRAFGRPYNFLLSILLLCTSLSGIPMAISPTEDNDICMLRPLLLGLCLKLLLAVLLAKETKIFFKIGIKRLKISKTSISSTRIFSFLVPFGLLGVGIHLLWRYVQPNEYITVSSTKYSSYFENGYIRECSYSVTFTVIEIVIDSLMLLFFLYTSWRTKDVANEHNDSLGLFLSACVLTVLGGVMTLIDFSIYTEPDSVLLTRGMGIQISIILVNIFQFGIKQVLIFVDEDAKKITSSGSSAVQSKGGSISASLSTTSKISQSNSVFKSSQMSTLTHTKQMTMSKLVTTKERQ